MTAPIIAQLIIALGPPALELIQKLSALWTKPELTPEEVSEICKTAQKSYDDYITEAKNV